MKEELKNIIGDAVLDGVSSTKTVIRMAKTLNYWNTHLSIIVKDLEKDETTDVSYVKNVLKNGLDILCKDKTEA